MQMLSFEQCRSWNRKWKKAWKEPSRKSRRKTVQNLEAKPENVKTYSSERASRATNTPRNKDQRPARRSGAAEQRRANRVDLENTFTLHNEPLDLKNRFDIAENGPCKIGVTD